MIKKLLFLLVLMFGVRYSVLPVFAQDDFDTKIVVDYKYDESGQSTVVQKINITYNNSQKYVTKYRFKILGTNISNLKAYDAKGPLETRGTNDVEVKLNSIVVGKGNSTSFVVSYTGNKATNNGKVWEISLPSIENWHQHKELTLNLLVPKRMGQMAFMSPNASSATLNYDKDYQLFTFTKERLGDNQVIAAFGNLQSLSFDLTYHLDVPGQFALPSDDNYQRVFINSIDPAPDNLIVDGDGNWLAQYPDISQPLDIHVKGQAHVLSAPTKLSIEPSYEDLQKYLSPTQYWNSKDPNIVQLAQNLTTPKQIYDWVVNNLQYDHSRAQLVNPPRRLASEVILDPSHSLCYDFTDTFISIARASGISARSVVGQLEGENNQHAWPQYWDWGKRTWISIDPTLGNTSGGVNYFSQFDFNHLAFARKGLSDTLPNLPLSKVSLHSSEYLEKGFSPLLITWTPPWQIFSVWKTRSSIEVTNPNGQAVYHLPIWLTETNLNLKIDRETNEIEAIPPFGKVKINFTFLPNWRANFDAKSFSFFVGGQEITYNVERSLFLFWHVTLSIIIAIIFLALGYLAIFTGRIYLQRRKRQDHLRRQSQESKK